LLFRASNTLGRVKLSSGATNMDRALMSERRYTPAAFAVQIEGDDPLRIVVRGELDVATAPQLREGLQAAAERGAQEMVLDASGLDFIDSVGIGLLVAQKRRALSEGRTFGVVAPSANVAGLIDMMGLTEYLDVS
jgi:anti-sigma B factor antagonist